jgi:hypothetical protein
VISRLQRQKGERSNKCDFPECASTWIGNAGGNQAQHHRSATCEHCTPRLEYTGDIEGNEGW